MPEKMSREKINNILRLTESVKAESEHAHVIKLCQIVEICINTIDDIQEDLLFLEEENERLKYEVEDKRIERQERGRGYRGGRTTIQDF